MRKQFGAVAFAVVTFAIVSLLSAARAQAVTIFSFSDTTGYATSSTDVIEGLLPTTISGTQDQESINSDTSGKALTNGLFAAAGIGNASTDLTIVNNGAVITYTLPATSTGAGWTLSQIDTFSAWRDTGRLNQDYTISYATTTNPAFTTLTTVDKAYSGTGIPAAALQVDVTGLGAAGGGLEHVTALEFSFPSTQNTYVGYREIDVIGAPTPEPSSFVLIGLAAAGVGLVAFGRKRAAAQSPTSTG